LKTLLMLFVHLCVLVVVFYVAFGANYGFGWNALIQSPFGERINTIADAVNGQLRAAPSSEWNEILKSFGQIYRVKFFLFDAFGRQLAGENVELPQGVLNRFLDFQGPPFGAFAFATAFGGPENQRNGAHADGPLPPPPAAPGQIVIGAQLIPGAKEGAQVDSGEQRFAGYGFARAPHSQPSIAADDTQRRIQGVPPQMMPPQMMECMPAPSPPSKMPAVPQHSISPSKMQAMPPTVMPGHMLMMSPEVMPGPMQMMPPEVMPGHMHILPPSLRTNMHAGGQFMVRDGKPLSYWLCSRILFVPMETRLPIPALLVANTSEIWQSKLLFDFQFALAIFGVVLGISLLIWLPFIYVITSSLSRMTFATEKIADGNFETRLNVKGDDELGRLTAAINQMAERLEAFVQGQKRFLGDISHELFSPLARMQMAAELLDSENDASLVKDIKEDVQEMTHLAEELIAFSKAGLKGRQIEFERIKVKSAIQSILEKLDCQSKVTVETAAELAVFCDQILFERALSNVIRNSLRYAGEYGPIEIKALNHGATVSITVTDHGPGVPESALKSLGEPFFRPESSRSREFGGVGLGLAIVKSCVEACNGSLSLRNGEQGGLQVEIRLCAD
jgi:two-component system sensor histidine kinase CpxA